MVERSTLPPNIDHAVLYMCGWDKFTCGKRSGYEILILHEHQPLTTSAVIEGYRYDIYACTCMSLYVFVLCLKQASNQLRQICISHLIESNCTRVSEKVFCLDINVELSLIVLLISDGD